MWAPNPDLGPTIPDGPRRSNSVASGRPGRNGGGGARRTRRMDSRMSVASSGLLDYSSDDLPFGLAGMVEGLEGVEEEEDGGGSGSDQVGCRVCVGVGVWGGGYLGWLSDDLPFGLAGMVEGLEGVEEEPADGGSGSDQVGEGGLGNGPGDVGPEGVVFNLGPGADRKINISAKNANRLKKHFRPKEAQPGLRLAKTSPTRIKNEARIPISNIFGRRGLIKTRFWPAGAKAM
jgi:hypothetical protein